MKSILYSIFKFKTQIAPNVQMVHYHIKIIEAKHSVCVFKNGTKNNIEWYKMFQ